MKMKIVWSKFAEDNLDEIYTYYLEHAGEKIARNLIRSLIRHPEYLINNPKAGRLEELLQNRETEYRYIVFRNYKIIYSINQALQLIQIADVFDTRQNPVKISRKK
jgi:plasmid stabilization system protein ParE